MNTGFAAVSVLGYESPPIYLNLGLGVGYDSNLYDTEGDEVSSFYYQPRLDMGFNTGNSKLGMQGVYRFDAFLPDADDTAISSKANIGGYWSPSIRNTFSISVLHYLVDERRGSGLTDDAPFSVEDLDTYTVTGFGLEYLFINPRQKSVFLNLSYSENNKEYESTRSSILFANENQEILGLDLGYQWSSDKKLYTQTSRNIETHPSVNSSLLNGVIQIVAIGLDWELSPALDFFIVVGEENKEFDVGNTSYSTDYWNVAVSWSPLLYTSFLIESGNQQEPLTEENQTLNELNTLSLNWTYDWSTDYRSVFQISKEETYSIVNENDETEENLFFSVSIHYRDFQLAFNWVKEEDNSQNYSQFSVALTYTLKGGF